MADAKTPLLTLDTLSERQIVRINGEDYELRNAGELSILAYHRLGQKSERVGELLNVDEPTEQQVTTLRAILDELAREILVAPDEVYKLLRDLDKMRLVQAFNATAEEGAPTAEDEDEPAPLEGLEEALSTGESTSPS